MKSKQLFCRYAYLRINSKINENTNLKTNSKINKNVCQYCNIEKANITIRLKHEKYCDKKHFYDPTEIIVSKEMLTSINEELIIEDDWLKLLNYYEQNYIENLLNDYKKAYYSVKHLQNEKLLILLDKISDESHRFRSYLNDKTSEYPYWSQLTLHDFQIS